MKITTILCISLTIPVFFHAGCATALPDANEPPTTMPWLTTDGLKPAPIIRAETVEDALAYSKDERIALEDVQDGNGQLGSSAMYVLLRRAQMLPEGDKTLDETERPNPKNFWREPERYRGRLVQVSVRYGGRVQLRTGNTGKQDVWMVDVLVEAKKTEPPTYERMLVVMGHEPPKNLKKQQPLELVGIFYKLAKLREAPKTGDPDVKHEYPVIVAASLSIPQPGEDSFRWGAVLMIIAVMVMLFVFTRLRRTVSRQRAAGRREYKPMKPDDSTDEAKTETDVEVNEELIRQVESYQAERKGKNADNT